jgi:hypothetical protein
MKEQAETFTPIQSLELITRMIEQAKGNAQRNSFHFLLWGWVIIVANIGMFALYQIDYERPYIVWLITIPAWLVTLYKVFTGRTEASYSTHLGTISTSLWLSYGVTIFTLVAFGAKINFQISPLILLITAVPTFVSGIIMKFNWLKFGGLTFWLGGIISFMLPLSSQPLVAAVCILLGYLIPGYRLKSTTE